MTKLNRSITAAFSAAVLVLTSLPVIAQVEVVESQNRVFSPSSPQPVKVAGTAVEAQEQAPSNATADLFYHVQTLQQEVSQLRGMLEEQAHEIKRLKQQRMDDYLDLDRRIGAGATGSAAKPAVDTSAVKTSATEPNEMQRYRTAIDLVLKQKDYDQAIAAFKEYLREYPQGRFAANSKYWLGEIYLLQNELEPARQWFNGLLVDHPQHAKSDDARYKLGVVYHKLGDEKKARELLKEVASGNTKAARLASIYLSENLP